MGRLLLLVLFACCAPFAPSAVAQVPQEAPDRAAVDAYRAGDLASARSLWLELNESEVDGQRVEGRERGRLLYNLGNVAARENQWLEAVGWYTSALPYRPRDEDLWANLELARLRADLPPADRGDLIDTLRRLLSSFTPAESQWLALLGLLPLALALGVEALRGGAVARRCAWSALVISLVLAGPFLYSSVRGQRAEALVVDARGSSLRSEPRPDATAIERVDAGARLERLDELPGWVKVRLSDGTKGWTRADDVFALDR